MVLTDVPQSGIYFQKGAVVEIVVQLLDQQTGNPIQLQTATGLSISLGYPDGVTSQSFSASLYTDGSDGQIKYTTVNNGIQVDLSQVGLYRVQGNAVVGGVAMPPSYLTDFYVLANVSGSSPSPIFNPSALIMLDSGSVRWGVTITTSGTFVFAPTPTGPPNFLQFNTLVMKDPNGVYWLVTMSTSGAFVTTPGGTFQNAVDYFPLVDANGKTWIVTITTAGVLIAS